MNWCKRCNTYYETRCRPSCTRDLEEDIIGMATYLNWQRLRHKYRAVRTERDKTNA